MSRQHDRDEGGLRIPSRMIGKQRQRIQKYRREVQRALSSGSLSGEMHDDFAVEVLAYFDVLREFRDESSLQDAGLPDVSPIRERLGFTVQVTVDAPGFRRRGQKRQEVPAVRELDIDHLIRLSHELDDSAQALGFGATAADTTPHGKAGRDDLKALLKTRGQDGAVSNLPGETGGGTE